MNLLSSKSYVKSVICLSHKLVQYVRVCTNSNFIKNHIIILLKNVVTVTFYFDAQGTHH